MLKNKYLNYLLNMDLVLTGITFIILVSITFAGVIMRYFFNNPFVWLEEVQLMCFVWIVFFGAGAAFRTGSHVSIEFLIDRLPPGLKKVAEIGIAMVVVAVLYFYSAQGFKLVEQLARTGRTTNIFKIPYPIIYGAFPIGCILMIINYLLTLFPSIWKEEGKEGTI